MTTTNKPSRIRYVTCIANKSDSLSLTPGQYYQVLPDSAETHGRLCVIDNTGEDYLFDARLFEEATDTAGMLADVNVSLMIPMKASLFQLANQRGMSMAALLREWIDERLDLPVNV